MSDNVRLVRIKPFNPKKGYLVRTYTVGGIRFKEEVGWYSFNGTDPVNFAESLREHLQIETDPESQPVFDVCSPDEALAMENREKGRPARATAAQANPAPSSTHKDVRKRTVQGAVKAAAVEQAAVAPKVEHAQVGSLVLPAALFPDGTIDPGAGPDDEDEAAASGEAAGEDEDALDLRGDTDFGSDDVPVPTAEKKLGPPSPSNRRGRRAGS